MREGGGRGEKRLLITKSAKRKPGYGLMNLVPPHCRSHGGARRRAVSPQGTCERTDSSDAGPIATEQTRAAEPLRARDSVKGKPSRQKFLAVSCVGGLSGCSGHDKLS